MTLGRQVASKTTAFVLTQFDPEHRCCPMKCLQCDRDSPEATLTQVTWITDSVEVGANWSEPLCRDCLEGIWKKFGHHVALNRAGIILAPVPTPNGS